MTDSTQQASDEQTSSGEQSQAGSQRGTNQKQAPEQTSEPKELSELPAWAQKQIRDARKDAETARKKVQEFEDANKTELQKREEAATAAAKRAEAAEQRLRDANARSAVLTAATKANANDPDAIFALASPRLEFDDEGEPTNVDAVIKALRDDRPDRFRAASGSGDGGKRDSESKPDFKTPVERLSHAYAVNREARRR